MNNKLKDIRILAFMTVYNNGQGWHPPEKLTPSLNNIT